MVDKKRSPDFGTGAARAALGQGLMMGWGDEAEAWLRTKMGEGSYADNLRKIRNEYGQFSSEYPVTSGVAEFGGAALPAIGAMMIPGGQAAGATTGLKALAKLAAIGAGEGAISGAGSADEDSRLGGAVTGGVLGGTLGVVAPVGIKGASAGAKWLQERLNPTEAIIARRAAEKMTAAMGEGEIAPKDIPNILAQDRALRVPSVVANANPALVDLAEAVAQRTGKGARKVAETLTDQKLGSRERTYSKAQKALNPGDYYDDLENLRKEMKQLSGPAYQQAYSFGEVKDPKVLQYLQLPQFRQGLKEAEELLAAEGRQLDMSRPTVEVLDQVKRGVDKLIEKETDAVTGKVSTLGGVYINKKNEFLKALDAAVPDYELARGIYAGGAELQDAMRMGLNDFGKMDHEQVIKAVSKMSKSEKEAFRTGVARGLYSKVMDPSGNFNAAQRVIGAPEMQAKLQPLFDNPAQFDLFKNALERESQLFQQANQVLGGSQTGKRMQMRENLEDTTGVGEAIGQAMTGGFWNSLVGTTTRALRKTQMPEKTAEKLSQMLMAKDPHEVAAVVQLLEKHAAETAPKAYRATIGQAGVVGGAAGAMWPSPQSESEPAVIPSIEEYSTPKGFSIEDAIRLEDEARQK